MASRPLLATCLTVGLHALCQTAAVLVFLHPADEFYGADRVALDVLTRLAQSQDVELWLPTDLAYPAAGLSGPATELGIPVRFVDLPVLRRDYQTPSGLVATAGRARTLRRLLRERRPDHVYVNTTALAPAVPIGRTCGAQVWVHVHEAFGRRERLLLAPMLAPAQRIIVVSDSVRTGLPRPLRARAEVVRHRITESVRAVDRTAAPALRAGIGLTDADTVVLVASRWTPAKGVPVVVEAMARVLRPDVHLVIAGGPPPSGRSADVAGLAAASRVRDRIHVIGELPELRGWLAASDVVAVPSVFPDPYPTIALEAAAAGVPLLASDIGGLPEIVTAELGQLLPPGDVEAWAQALAALPARSEACA